MSNNAENSMSNNANVTGLSIRVFRDDLRMAVSRATTATDRSKHPRLPVLANVKLGVSGGVLSVSGTNLETAVTRRLSGNGYLDGAVTVKAAVLGKLLSIYDDNIVTLESDTSDDSLFIECGMNTTHIKGTTATEYPLCPAAPDNVVATVDAADLAQLIDDVYFCAATGKWVAKQFFYVYVTVANGRLSMKATDGARDGSGSISASCAANEHPVSFTVSGSVLKKMVHPLIKEATKSKVGGTAVSISLLQAGSSGTVWFSTNQAEISGVMLDGEYTSYPIENDDFDVSAVVDVKPLMAACKVIKAVHGRGRYREKTVVFSIADGVVDVSSSANPSGGVSVPVNSFSTNGRVVIVSERIDFVMQMIKRFDHRVELSCNSGLTLLRISDGGGCCSHENNPTYLVAI